ncbi:acyl-CoA thioesterase [candidate division KSB3 bacterium]|uniref:Acyl-CoA thioesterase n=1 Tax=candidate division KSB3 bacterium TaxID=2044937 RepID=A0A9D5JTM6_9BACT|nr:acyl-CoA thioesterase [candidate division KSB3 bacterium]MBD3324033.1 acyl-CoA thioesterase [candidate division KSB3 bacterium]
MLPERPLEVELVLPVKTYDIDFAGIVSNIVYIRWLEDLRLKMLEQYLPLDQQIKADISPILMQTQIQYRKAVTLLDAPVGRMWMSDLSRMKWWVTAEIAVNGVVAATAEQYGCFIQLSTTRPIRIPAELLKHYHTLRR